MLKNNNHVKRGNLIKIFEHDADKKISIALNKKIGLGEIILERKSLFSKSKTCGLVYWFKQLILSIIVGIGHENSCWQRENNERSTNYIVTDKSREKNKTI